MSIPNNGYGQYPVSPRKTKPVSEESQSAEQVPSSSGGIQVGKVAIQACGAVIGSGIGTLGVGYFAFQDSMRANPLMYKLSTDVPDKSFWKDLFKGGNTTRWALAAGIAGLIENSVYIA